MNHVMNFVNDEKVKNKMIGHVLVVVEKIAVASEEDQEIVNVVEDPRVGEEKEMK